MSLTDLLDAYVEHQKEVVTKRSRYDLNKAKERQHIVEGLIKAISILDDVINIIRASTDKRDAKKNLMSAYDFTESQAEAIVSLQLYRLTNTDITQLQQEAAELEKKIAELTEILSSEKKLQKVIIKELRDIKKKYSDKRRTEIEEKIEELKVSLEVLIPDEDVVVTVTNDGYLKRTSLRSYAASNWEDFGMKESDHILAAYEMSTLDVLLLFTNKGNYIYCPVHRIPDIRWKDTGRHISSFMSTDHDERIVSVLPVKEFERPGYLLFITRNGIVKKTELNLYKAQRHLKPLIAINLKDDELVQVGYTNGTNEIFLATSYGYGIRFDENEIKPIGVRATGVKGINLKEGDYVVGGGVIRDPERQSIILATQRGAVKRLPVNVLDLTKRANRGLVLLRELKTKPHHLIGAILAEEDTIHIISEDNVTEELTVNSLPFSERYSNGSFYMNEEEAGPAVKLIKVIQEPEKLPENEKNSK